MRLLLFTGAGAASSSRATAAAVQAARSGIKTTYLANDAATDPDVAGLDEPGLAVVRGDRPEIDLGDVVDQLGMDPVPTILLAAVPGLTEVTRWLSLPDLVARGPADLVVADLGPADAAARLLAAPAGMRACLDHLLPVGRRVERAMSLAADPLTESVDRLRARLAAVEDLLSAPGTALRLVPGDGGSGGRRWLPWLAAYGCRVESHGSAGQDPVGADALLAPPVLPQPRRLDVEGSGYRLRLRMPLAHRDDLALHRVDDDLVLDASAGRVAPAVIALPSVLRRCQAVGARLEGAGGPDAELQVRFVPDPDLWPNARIGAP